ncbi:MAG: deoxyribodipyrimidine photo-lyase, partial [Phycisphaerae bacterium]
MEPKRAHTNARITIVWFRRDLRLADNPALHAAARLGPVVPVFVWSPHEEGDWPLGAAARWWLHQSLAALDDELRKRGSRLIIRTGDSTETLKKIVRATDATAVHFNRRYEPAPVSRDARLARALADDGI